MIVWNVPKLIKNLLQLLSDYSMVKRVKVYIQKSTAFLFTSNELLKFGIKNTAHTNIYTVKYKSSKICTRSLRGKL